MPVEMQTQQDRLHAVPKINSPKAEKLTGPTEWVTENYFPTNKR